MEVYLNSISGVDDAICSMFFSKRHMTREFEEEIRDKCAKTFDRNGKIMGYINPAVFTQERSAVDEWIKKLLVWGKYHVTMLKFIDLSFTVYGLHRAGQDDWDSHAQRMNNRIIRESTRLSTFGEEKSDYYKDKILTTDEALSVLEVKVPGEIIKNGIKYVKTTNGYIREDMKDNKDVKRGLYMLSIPSSFIFKVDLANFAHMYKERWAGGTANPEVKDCAEMCGDQLHDFLPWVTKEYLRKVQI